MRTLTPLEARVLGVLVEKEHTVPDTYPLSLNALTMGCNQKTARVPVMEAAESDVLAALDALKALSLVYEGPSSRVTKYQHNLRAVLKVPGAAEALLATLMLRGAQTAAELRANSERLHRFADISAVEGFLEELSAKTPPLLRKLPRAPGAREARWVHLLCGEPSPEMLAAAASSALAGGGEGVAAGELAALKAEVTRQAGEIERLQAQLAHVAAELGIALDSGS